MAGKITVSTINDSSGVLATQNGMTGICKAWVNWNGLSGASPVVRSSFNISSVTRTATGAYTLAFTTALADANYCVTYGSVGNSATNNTVTMNISGSYLGPLTSKTTTQLAIIAGLSNSAGLVDTFELNVAVFGN